MARLMISHRLRCVLSNPTAADQTSIHILPYFFRRRKSDNFGSRNKMFKAWLDSKENITTESYKRWV